MSTTTVLAIYFLVWWITLFAVLPFGMSRQAEEGDTPGTDPGAPLAHVMWRKLGWTTVFATIVFAVLYVVHVSGVLIAPLDWLIRNFGPPLRYRRPRRRLNTRRCQGARKKTAYGPKKRAGRLALLVAIIVLPDSSYRRIGAAADHRAEDFFPPKTWTVVRSRSSKRAGILLSHGRTKR
jgi:predicted secreted protein